MAWPHTIKTEYYYPIQSSLKLIPGKESLLFGINIILICISNFGFFRIHDIFVYNLSKKCLHDFNIQNTNVTKTYKTDWHLHHLHQIQIHWKGSQQKIVCIVLDEHDVFMKTWRLINAHRSFVTFLSPSILSPSFSHSAVSPSKPTSGFNLPRSPAIILSIFLSLAAFL